MIHAGNPFRPEPEDQDQVRRFRGRLAAGVTIVTSATQDGRAGLTVSSVLIAEGEPARLLMLVGPTTDLWEAVGTSTRFVVHICRFEDRRLADAFAGLAPAPGGPFKGVEVSDTAWGPVLVELADRLYCTFQGQEEIGWSGVVHGAIDAVEVSDLDDPLVHFRSGYRRLAGQPG